IPFVALTSKPFHALARRNDFSDDALDDFKQAADRDNHPGRQPKTPGASDSTETQQQFANRICEEKAKGAVGKSVVIISRQTKVVARPESNRHPSVGIMRANDVKDDKRYKKKIRRLREL